MAFDPAEVQVFRSTGKYDFSSLVASISAERAEASVPSDKSLLMKQITETIGVRSFNERLRRFMESAIQTEVAQAALLRAEGTLGLHGDRGTSGREQTIPFTST